MIGYVSFEEKDKSRSLDTIPEQPANMPPGIRINHTNSMHWVDIRITLQTALSKVSAALPAPLSYNLRANNIAPLRGVSDTLVAIWIGVIRSVLQGQARCGTLQVSAAQKGEYIEVNFSYIFEDKTGAYASGCYTSGDLASVPNMGITHYMALLDSLSATWSIETTASDKTAQVVRLPIVP